MQEVIEKIQKLMALGNAARNNSSEEAAAAMAKAQELLAKYNLDLAVIQDATTKKATDATVSAAPREKVEVKRSAMYLWQQSFWHELATMNYCYHWVVIVREEHPSRPGYWRTVKRHVILGSAVNVAAVQVMGDYLTEVMERELPYPNVERLSRSAISWREGMADRLIDRLTERKREMGRKGFTAEDGTQVTALAVQDLHEKEYAANYDARYGAGAYARSKASQARWAEQITERVQKAKEERERLLGSETPEQRKEREMREAKVAAKQAAADAKAWERYQRRCEREAARKDVVAYARGTKKADTINLNEQVK